MAWRWATGKVVAEPGNTDLLAADCPVTFSLTQLHQIIERRCHMDNDGIMRRRRVGIESEARCVFCFAQYGSWVIIPFLAVIKNKKRSQIKLTS